MFTSSQMANKKASEKVRYKRLAFTAAPWHPENMKLKIAELRKKQGLTGEVLAARAGCSKSYISEIESGKKWPSGRLLKAFARELGVSIYDLIQDGEIADALIAHMAVMKDLSEIDQRAVFRHAAGLLEQGAEQTE